MARRKPRKAAPPPKPGRSTPPTGRYTPPKPKTAKRSALWLPATMFTCLALGVAVIVANYLELLPGGKAQNEDLFLGLGLLVAGFALSTQYR